jgi:hypothetical protein
MFAEPALAQNPKTIFYQLTYQTKEVTGVILINGFEAATFNGSPAAGGAPLNVWLIGKNTLEIKLKKSSPDARASFTCGVSRRVQGEVVTSTDKGTLMTVLLNNNDLSNTDSILMNKSFNSSLDFSHTLQDAETASKTEVLAYAKQIYTFYENKDVEGVVQESSVKLGDYSKAVGGMDLTDQLREMLIDGLFKEKLNPLIPGVLRAKAVGPTKNIWHVFNGKLELITTKSSDGSSSEVPVYIGKINGRLQIVR